MLPFGKILEGKALDCGRVAAMSIVNGHTTASRSAQQPAELTAMLCAFEVQTMPFAGKTACECGATKPCLPSYYYSYRYL